MWPRQRAEAARDVRRRPGANPNELRKQIEDALGRSVALAPELWTGHEAHANVLELRHDWVGAEQANARARALAPQSMREPIISRCNQLAAVGRIHEAIHFAREASRIEPRVPTPLAELLFYVGQHEESLLEYEREREFTNSPFVPEILACGRMMAIGDHAKAKHHLKLCAANDPGSPSFRREMLEVFDDAPRARALIHRTVETTPGRDFMRLLMIVRYAAYFGAHDLASTAYRRVAKHMIGVFIIGFWSPLQAEMRKLPGFKELVREVGLVSYWRTTGEWGEFARPVGGEDFECW